MSPQYGALRLTSGWDLLASLGHPSKFHRVKRLGSVTALHSSSGRQPNFAALNRGRHLYSAARPSRSHSSIALCILCSVDIFCCLDYVIYCLLFYFLLHFWGYFVHNSITCFSCMSVCVSSCLTAHFTVLLKLLPEMVNKDEYIFLSSLSVISVAILFKARKLNLAIWRLEKGFGLTIFVC